MGDEEYARMIDRAPPFVDAEPLPSRRERERVAIGGDQPKRKLTPRDKERLREWTGK